MGWQRTPFRTEGRGPQEVKRGSRDTEARLYAPVKLYTFSDRGYGRSVEGRGFSLKGIQERVSLR